MNGKCIDIGTIQAFLDGETTAEVSLRVSDHIADCDACAGSLAIAEDESSFVFSTLEREMNTLVPTQRLWSRINESIEVEKSHQPIWKQVYAFISASLLSPSMTAAAGLLIVFGFVGVFWMRSGGVVDNTTVASAPVGQTNPQVSNPIVPTTSGVPPETSTPINGATHVKAGTKSARELETLVRDANNRNEIRPINAVYTTPLPGEKSYMKTISDFKEAYDGRRDAVMTGSSRIAFEKDLAVVNDGIKRMQKVVRKNPNNQAARQVLYSAYQDKIDLLNTVAQRDELMASIR
jgi:hypothetical protein